MRFADIRDVVLLLFGLIWTHVWWAFVWPAVSR